MLQTATSASGSKSPAIQPTAPKESEFPPAAQDLARASFRAVAPVPALEETVAAAILDEVDATLYAASGKHVLPKILEALGTDRATAIAMFVKEERNGTTASIIGRITGVPRDDIRRICPQADEASLENPARAEALTKEVFSLITKNGLATPGHLAIESLTSLTSAPDDDYSSQRQKVVARYEQSLVEACETKGVEVIAFAAGRAGDALGRAARAAGMGITAGAKAIGIFLLRSLITQHLPRFIKDKIALENDSSVARRMLSAVASGLLSGAATTLLGGYLLVRLGAIPPSYSVQDFVLRMGPMMIMGGLGELMVKAISAAEEDRPIGSLALESVGLLYRLGALGTGKVGQGLESFRDKNKERKINKLKEQGLL